APGHPDGTLVNALLYHCGGPSGAGYCNAESGGTEGLHGTGYCGLSGIGGVLRPGIVHRIDRDTSGLLIAAKNDAAHQALAAQLKDHTLARTYRCIVVGNLREDAGTVDAPVGRSRTDRKRMAVYPPAPPGADLQPGVRNAVTHWRVVERLRGGTDVECRLETGRTHQIRVHMAHLGHPVLGDPVYGRAVQGLTGQCLHAAGLRFLHPRTGEAVELWCDLPGEYVRTLEKMRQR
ncbi:MAG: hypothetical protein IJT94_11035, partial [Oscillibacter sp.]|nr:hypothetical protein [Oscillibacter sp.]